MHKSLYLNLIIFILINVFLFAFIIKVNNLFSFNKFNYVYNAHHYLLDQRIKNGNFNLLNALGQYDAQWYLKIAEKGYPKNPTRESLADKTKMEGLSYAFFPLYPLILHVINFPFKNIEIAAFMATIIFLVADFLSLNYVTGKLYNPNIAIKTSFLLFLFPFSIFYRSYFTEGLFLFLLIWFSYFLIKKRWLTCALLLGLLTTTRGVGIFMFFPFFYYLWKDLRLQKISTFRNWEAIIIAFVPISLWITYCFWQTGNGFYFFSIRTAWEPFRIPFLHNIFTILSFPNLPLHGFHYSQIDILTIVFVFYLLVLSVKILRPELWIIAFFLWIGPLLIQDTISFSRFQIVSFPLFLYLAIVLKEREYKLLLIAFGVLLCIVSLFFVNWFWIG